MNISAYKTYKTRTFTFGDAPDLLLYMEHKRGRDPRYIAVKQGTSAKTTGKMWAATSGAKSDLDILVDEELMILGGGDYPLTGYGFTRDKPVTTHRGIHIGKFKLRTKSKHLPKYGAILHPNRKIEGQTIEDVKTKIDRILD